MPADTQGVRGSKLNDILVILATVCVFAAVSMFAHRDAPYFGLKLVSILGISLGCMLATRDRESWDIFFGVIAALFTLFAIAMTADFAVPHWWTKFLVFTGIASSFVLATRKKREILLGIMAIVGL